MLGIVRWVRVGLLAICAFSATEANAATIKAATCARADVLAAYTAAVNGDTILVPAGNCDSSNQWSSYLTIQKEIVIQGAGAGATSIGISNGSAGFQVQASNVRITGITFDCNYTNTSNAGIIRVGSSAANPTYVYANFRIDNNIFNQCGASGGDTTGREALTLFGYIYGVIDHNTFNDCNGECLNICADAVRGTTRSVEFGQYSNGTVFVENNIFNANRSGILYENTIDGNSSQRFTFRYNVINVANGARYASGIVSTHETCVPCSGSSTSGGDAGSLVYEMYENTINLNTTGTMRDLGIVRGGRALIYNNRITYSGSSAGRWHVASWLSNYRSIAAYGATPSDCRLAARPRGYSASAHEVDPGYTSEGLDANKTTLNGGITASQTTLNVMSSAGLSPNGLANGFAVKIDNEVIQYTGVSGNTLTGLVRGVNGTTPASHGSGGAVHYLKFGKALEQVNNVHIWNNQLNGVVSATMNDVYICGLGCAGISGPDYTELDIQSHDERPNNWQYRTGVAFNYTPYPHPHPLIGGSPPVPPQAPTNLRIIAALTTLPLFMGVAYGAVRRSRT